MENITSPFDDRETGTLGQPIRVYRGEPLKMRDLFGRRVWWFFPGILFVLGFFIYGGYRAMLGYAQFGPAAGGEWGRPWFSVAGLGLIPLLFFFIRHMMIVRRAVTLHKNGLSFTGFPIDRLHWGQISGVSTETTRFEIAGKGIRTRNRVWIFPSAGKPIQLREPLENIPHLVSKIKKHIYPRIYPQLIDGFRKGQWAYFGAVKISPAKFNISRKSYPWDQIEHISLEQGKLNILLKKTSRIQRRETVPSAKIQNVELLLDLIEKEVKA